ncbi:MAG: hypothetical protein HW381_2058, partial [Candidatus Rokubacteria bacterium]|nr:hypothetical protein [Candidatus Rokubacteria bacterium]
MNPMSRRRFVAVTVTGLTLGTGPRPARAAGPAVPSPAQWQA